MDESDNTGKSNVLATIIDEFNPGWDSGEEYDSCFWKAVGFAKLVLENHFKAVAGIYRAKTLVDKAMEECDGDVLVLPEFAPWKGEAAGSSYKFVVYPSSRGGFSAQGVPVSIDDKTLVCPFPMSGVEETQKNLYKLQVFQLLGSVILMRSLLQQMKKRML